MSNAIKVGYILSYKDPGYIRTRALLQMLDTDKQLEVATAINTSRSVFRYIETLCKTIKLRILNKPNIYILGFRGYEIYWPVRIITLGKPLVFDEFINLHDWLVCEHGKVKPEGMAAKAIKLYMYWVVRTSQAILSDTQLHAINSSETYNTDTDKYVSIYVGADEDLFTPVNASHRASNKCTVFFYGTFLPLHGMRVILAAAEKLKDKPIEFTIIGGASRSGDMVGFEKYLKERDLSNVTHKPWVNFEELPGYIARADICLGGPFGDTSQAHKVITGKTFQFLAMKKLTVIGRIEEDAGFMDKENCLIVRQDDADELARAIEWAYEHPDSIDAIAESGRKLYEERFSVHIQASTLISTLKNLR